MGPLSYMRSVVHRIVVIWRMPVIFESVYGFLRGVLYRHFVSGSYPSAFFIFELNTTYGSNVTAE